MAFLQSIFPQKIDIYSDSISAKSTFVETFWRHDVTEKLGCFLAPKKRWLFEEFWCFTTCENGVFFGVSIHGSMCFDWLVN